MEGAPNVGGPPGVSPQRGGFRGRGLGGPPMRGRGRGMGRGHFMGGAPRGGGAMGMQPQGMMGMRGMRVPRGGQMGYQGRGGGFPPRPPMRGGRVPMYPQQTKQHTGAENNKTVSPITTPSGTTATSPTTENSTSVSSAATTNNNDTTSSPPAAVTPATGLPVNGNGISSSGPISHSPRGAPRGRGGIFNRGGGRGGGGGGGGGGYNPHQNGGMHGGHMSGMGIGGPGPEHGQMSMRRGGPPRGRGGYGHGLQRPPPMHQPHTANTQIAPVPALKRGAPGGPQGPKRIRYDGGPYSQRPMAPKYQSQQQHVSMPSQSGYGAPPTSHHQQQQTHHGYVDQSQAVDPYAQSYAAPASAYNGYSQSTGYATHSATAAPQASTSYATHGSEYDQSQYQSYNSSTYGTQQDTRYQTYGQDYTQQYGSPAVDYNTAQQADYSQHHSQQAYDERAYAGYDTQAYQQSYANASGYY